VAGGRVKGYFLRIARDEWVEKVFESGRYYTLKRMAPAEGTYVFFLKKTEVGDSVIGYGVVKRTAAFHELTPAEREACMDHGWDRCIVFKRLTRLSRPVPVKELPVDFGKAYGKYLHGRKVEDEELMRILEALEAEKP